MYEKNLSPTFFNYLSKLVPKMYGEIYVDGVSYDSFQNPIRNLEKPTMVVTNHTQIVLDPFVMGICMYNPENSQSVLRSVIGENLLKGPLKHLFMKCGSISVSRNHTKKTLMGFTNELESVLNQNYNIWLAATSGRVRGEEKKLDTYGVLRFLDKKMKGGLHILPANISYSHFPYNINDTNRDGEKKVTRDIKDMLLEVFQSEKPNVSINTGERRRFSDYDESELAQIIYHSSSQT